MGDRSRIRQLRKTTEATGRNPQQGQAGICLPHHQSGLGRWNFPGWQPQGARRLPPSACQLTTCPACVLQLPSQDLASHGPPAPFLSAWEGPSEGKVCRSDTVAGRWLWSES